MNNAARIAEIVLPVVVSLFLGWLSRLKNILSRAQIDGLKTFVVTFSLPAVLFMAFAEIAYGLDVYKRQLLRREGRGHLRRQLLLLRRLSSLKGAGLCRVSIWGKNC